MGPVETSQPFEERPYTIAELAKMWNFSPEFVRQIVRGEAGVTSGSVNSRVDVATVCSECRSLWPSGCIAVP
jgi:hypothetical protein